MPLYSFQGLRPRVHEDAWIAPTAVLIGDVTVEAGASVWFNAVLRADGAPIVVREQANVQDGSVLHGGPTVTEIGRRVTVGHCCVVHTAVIGEQALIGNHATVLDGATVGARTLVAAGSVVTPNTVLPPGVLAIGSPARVRGPLSDAQRLWVESNADAYLQLVRSYVQDCAEVPWEHPSGRPV